MNIPDLEGEPIILRIQEYNNGNTNYNFSWKNGALLLTMTLSDRILHIDTFFNEAGRGYGKKLLCHVLHFMNLDPSMSVRLIPTPECKDLISNNCRRYSANNSRLTRYYKNTYGFVESGRSLETTVGTILTKCTPKGGRLRKTRKNRRKN
jgi:hypothetical protein